MKNIRVLNLERTAAASTSLRRALETDFDLDWRRVGEESDFRNALAEQNWDIVISSGPPEDLDHVEAFESIADAGLDIPFIIISEKADHEAAVSAMRLGVGDYIAKNDLGQLVPSVVRVLREAEVRQEKWAAEKALAESEDRMRLALRAAGIGAWESDLTTGDAVWSPETSAIIGVPVAGSKAVTIQKMIHPDDIPSFEAAKKRAVERRAPFDLRFRLVRRGGDVRWIAVNAKCEYDDRGTPAKLVGTVRDVTGEKEAEDALLAAEERYRVMAESAADAVISIDDKSTILFVNPALERMFGYTKDELIGQSIRLLMADDKWALHKRGIGRYIESGEKAVDWSRVETKARRKDGTEIAVQISFGEYHKEDKHVFTGFLRDVTFTQKHQEALLRSEQNFRALAKATSQFVWQTDEQGNPQGPLDWWVDLTGQPVSESSMANGWAQFIHPDDRERVAAEYEDHMRRGVTFETGARILDRSGRYRFYLATAVPVPGPQGTRWIGTLKDVHDQRTTEQRYRIVSTISSDYVFSGRLNENGDITLDWMAGAFESITGYDLDEFNEIGGWRAIVHPDDHAKDSHDLERLLGNETVESEVRILNKAGEAVWVRVVAEPIWDATRGRVTGMYGAVQDITGRKTAEIAMRERESYLQSVLDAEPECVKIFGPGGVILDINPAGRAIMEADSPDEVIGQIGLKVLDAADVEPVTEALDQAMAGETVTVEYQITGLKGTRRRLEMRAAPIRNADGTINSVLGVSRDITEKHRIEAALIESEKQYADLINTVEGIVWELNAETMEFTFVSRQAEAILGYPLSRWYEKDFWPKHIHDADRERAVSFCIQETAKGEGHTFEYRMIAEDGRVVWLRDIVTVVMEAGKPKILRGLMVDVTEQRRMDAAMKQQALLIEQANEAIFVWDFDHGVIEWNRGCEKLYGYSREEMLGKFAYDVLRTQFPGGVNTFREKLTANGSWSAEVAKTTRSGETVMVDSRAQLIELDGRKAVLQTSRDVTETRRAEDALRRSELRYRHLFENNPYPMWVYDVETLRFLAVNDAAVQHYGYTADEFRAMKITDIRPDEDVPMVVERAILTTRQVDSSGHWRHLKKDGTLINVQITSHSLDFEGRRARLVLANDVTDRLRAEEALRQSEGKYRELVANANDIIYTHDLKGRFTSLNHAGERITGYTEEEAKKMSLIEAIGPEFMEQARVMMEKKLIKGAATIYETELVAKDGSRIPVEINSRLIFENGKPVGVQGVARDFTERRAAEEELRRQRERLDKTAEVAPVSIFSLKIGADGRRTVPFASPASLKVFGIDPAELEGSAEPIFDRILPDYKQSLYRAIGNATEDRSPVNALFEYDHPERGSTWVEIYAAPAVETDGSLVWHGIAADVTDQKLAEAALYASEEQLRQSQKLESIGILAGGLAHDFNNMLTAINGYSDLILRRVATEDPVRRHVEEIKKAGERSAEMTRQLLAFSRRQILQPTTLDLNGVIADTTSMLSRLIGEDVTLTTKLDPDLAKIQADQGQLAQVLMNLLINARDAMPKGGSVVVETSNVELDEGYASFHINVAPGRYVMLAVSDTGIGMDEQTRARVFEPFFTTKAVGRGTGLGLSTVYGIVKQSGGNIWVYSEPGKGSTFKIYLPQAAASESAPAVQTDAEGRQVHVGSEKILLVEDEASVRGLARQILEACGYEVFEAANGVEALAKFDNECSNVDLILTDIVMPEMGGRELSERVLERKPETKVLFTSGYTDDAIIRHGIIDEGKNFLQKPFTFDGLARKVRSVLDGTGSTGNTGRLKATNN